jgi:hypothetical protein
MRRAVWAKAAGTAAALLLGAGTATADHKPSVSATELSDLKPAVRIEVAPLGYLPPSAFYLTYRLSSATIGFFDDEHLLFTFRVGGLLKRSPEDRTGDDDQEIRALVLDLKTGKVAKQTEWRLHDRAAYLWPYTDGRFLVRIRDSLFLADQSLELEPYLSLREGLREVEISPDRKLTVLEADEPEKPHTAVSLLGTGEAARPVKVMILPSGSRVAMAVSNSQNAVLLPLMNDGILDTLEGTKEASWVMREVPFHGKPRTIAEINSTCRPAAQPVSNRVVLMVGCYFNGNDHQVVAISTDGRELWQSRWQNKYVWGWFDYAENGSRFAYESVEVTRPISTFDALYPEDITAQLAGVYDTETGKLVLVKDASPILTAGQNVALSPDGKRFAILRDQGLEVYDLPPLSEPDSPKSKPQKKK